MTLLRGFRYGPAAPVLAICLLGAACTGALPSARTFSPSPTFTPAATATSSLSPLPAATAAPSIGPLVDQPLPAATVSALQALLDDPVANGRVPSLSAAVIVPGIGMWAGAAGERDTSTHAPATTDTAYVLGSISKTYISALTLRLVEEGKVSLDDPAADWLSPAAASKANGATVRQLLAMQSGIADYTENQALYDTDHPAWTPETLLDLVGPADFVAGRGTAYSNTNYVLLGVIDERVGGMPIEQLLHAYLLDPLGLDRTFLGSREPIREPFAHGYRLQSGALVDDFLNLLPVGFSAESTAGAMTAPPSDVVRWMYRLYGGSVVQPATLQQMLTFTKTPDRLLTYGLGVMRWTVPGIDDMVGHSGWTPGFTSGPASSSGAAS